MVGCGWNRGAGDGGASALELCTLLGENKRYSEGTEETEQPSNGNNQSQSQRVRVYTSLAV
jgi:hypothetical protein